MLYESFVVAAILIGQALGSAANLQQEQVVVVLDGKQEAAVSSLHLHVPSMTTSAFKATEWACNHRGDECGSWSQKNKCCGGM